MRKVFALIALFLTLGCSESKQTENDIEDINSITTVHETDWETSLEESDVEEEKSLFWSKDSFDVSLEEQLNPYWSYGKVYQVVMSEFPEAYEDFVEITYEKVEDRINPDVMSFVIPTKKLEQIDSVDIDKRFDRVAMKMHDFVGCQWYEIGEPETYAWLAWEDKEVTRIYFHFMFGC